MFILAGEATMGSLEGKVILITGASGGIGHATARHLHDEGAAVVATAPSSSQVKSLADPAGRTGDQDDLAFKRSHSCLSRQNEHCRQ